MRSLIDTLVTLYSNSKDVIMKRLLYPSEFYLGLQVFVDVEAKNLHEAAVLRHGDYLIFNIRSL